MLLQLAVSDMPGAVNQPLNMQTAAVAVYWLSKCKLALATSQAHVGRVRAPRLVGQGHSKLSFPAALEGVCVLTPPPLLAGVRADPPG